MHRRPLRIAFFGLPYGALLLARDGHDLVFAGLSRRAMPGERRLRALLGERVVTQPRPEALVAELQALRADLLVSWFWTQRLDVSVINTCRLGGINVHPSLLPRHRGPDPTYWTILLGDRLAGVTLHYLTEDYDRGPIIDSIAISVPPGMTSGRLAHSLDGPSLCLLRRTVLRLSEGEDVAGRIQDESHATQAPLPTDDDATICWNAPTAQILAQIRALSPAPGAFSDLSGRQLVVLDAVAARIGCLAPGQGAAWEGQAVVGTADGAIRLVRAEIDGQSVLETDLAAMLLPVPTEEKAH